jgi:hypothetical protein
VIIRLIFENINAHHPPRANGLPKLYVNIPEDRMRSYRLQNASYKEPGLAGNFSDDK